MARLFSLALLAFVACAKPRVDPELLRHRGKDYLFCRTRLAQYGIDADRENAPAWNEALRLREVHKMPFDAIVVPGYTPLDLEVPEPMLHPIAKDRLRLAAIDFQKNLAPFVVLSGGNVHPGGTPYNEAIEMKRFLVQSGFPEHRILVEPCARHSHTNLRNVARLLASAGLPRAMITTSYDQAYYFSRPQSSSFELRQLADFGYVVGKFHRADEHHVAFLPSPKVFTRGGDAEDP